MQTDGFSGTYFYKDENGEYKPVTLEPVQISEEDFKYDPAVFSNIAEECSISIRMVGSELKKTMRIVHSWSNMIRRRIRRQKRLKEKERRQNLKRRNSIG